MKSIPTSAHAAGDLPRPAQLASVVTRLSWQPALTGAGLLVLFIAGFAAIQFATPNLVGNDGYFHIKFAQVMRQQGLLPPFTWLPLTILNAREYFDHHFLFHVLLIPFTFGDIRLGAKWASVIFPALAFLSGWIFLRGQRVPYAAVWSLGFFAVSEAFLYRLSMTRVQAVSLLMLLWVLHVTLTRRYRWLLPLTFVYVWLYDGFPFIVVMVGLYVAARWLLERRLELRPLVYVLVAIGLGLVINPYFPQNIRFIYLHVLPKLIDATAINVGSEWFPFSTWDLVENSGLALAAFGAAILAIGLQERRIDTRTATLLLVTLFFGFLLLKSRRFVEYYPAFALLLCAVAWTPFIETWQRRAALLPAAVALIFLAGAAYNIHTNRTELQESKSYQRYAGAATWLQANTPAGSRVFQTDWDDFTLLYFHNTHNTYTLGLDPTYMQLQDGALYDLWRQMTQGRITNLAEPIATRFGASYVVTDLEHYAFIYAAMADPRLEEMFRDDYAAIFRVLPPPD